MRALSLLVSIVGAAAAPMTWSQTLEKLSFTLRAKCVDDGSQTVRLSDDLVNISCHEAVTGKLHAAQFQPRDDIDPAADKSGCKLTRSGAMECELSKAVPHMFDQLATDDALNQGALNEGGLTGEFGAAAGDDGSKTQDAERAFFQEYKVRGCAPPANRQPPTANLLRCAPAAVVPPPLSCPCHRTGRPSRDGRGGSCGSHTRAHCRATGRVPTVLRARRRPGERHSDYTIRH
jgi:hypothetical protein